MTPEFSRPVRLDTIGAEPRRLTIAAEENERAALARRFDLVAIGMLAADAEVSRDGDTIVAAGTLRAEVTQSCAATGAPVAEVIGEPFRILFRPELDTAVTDDEVELGEDELDVMFYDSASIDLGEAVAETLALSLDPYPRAPEADAVLRQAGVLDEGRAGGLGALANLADKLR